MVLRVKFCDSETGPLLLAIPGRQAEAAGGRAVRRV